MNAWHFSENAAFTKCMIFDELYGVSNFGILTCNGKVISNKIQKIENLETGFYFEL